jgi:hypothetical protein
VACGSACAAKNCSRTAPKRSITGSPAEGARTDAIDRIACPVRGPHWALLRMLDPQRLRIRFESRMNCRPLLRRSEFIDYAEHDFRGFPARPARHAPRLTAGPHEPPARHLNPPPVPRPARGNPS